MQHQPIAKLDGLPPELLTKIVLDLTAFPSICGSLKEAVWTVRNFARVNKKLHTLITRNEYCANALITTWAKRFSEDYRDDIVKRSYPHWSMETIRAEYPIGRISELSSTHFTYVASFLNTPAAFEWFKQYMIKSEEGYTMFNQKILDFHLRIQNLPLEKLEDRYPNYPEMESIAKCMCCHLPLKGRKNYYFLRKNS